MKKNIFIIIFTILFALIIVGCEKKEYDMSQITFESKSFEYDGTAKSLEINGALPEGVSVSYENNNQVEVGEYEVIAKFIGSSEYKPIPQMTATLTIVKRSVASLPDLTGKNETEIRNELNTLGFTNIKIVEVFNVTIFRGRFVKYNDFEALEEVSVESQIVVSIATRKLPDLTQMDVDLIEQFFIDAGVSKDNIIGVPQTTGDPDFGLGYFGAQAGDEYTTGQIRYLYNGSQVKLKDLTGYTIPQIDDYIRRKELKVQYHEVTDNSKEMDTFSEYVGFSTGQIVSKGTTIAMLININDDINQEKQLFISKSIEASPGNNGLELYNPLDVAIDLSDYYISIFENGSLWETYRIDLTATLAAKKTYFIASDTSLDEIKSKAHLVSENLIFDGNDTIQLRKKSNNTYIDAIYNIGNTSFTFADEIFIRREHITKGSRNFNIDEWAGYIPTFTEVINNHPYHILDHPTFELLDEIFPNYGMTLVRYITAADGDTVYFESLDPRDPGPYNANSRLRFLMVDTPETEKPGQEGQPYAQAAYEYTKNALSNASQIYIQSDRSAGIKDNYGRNLGVVWYNAGTVQNPDWRLLNYELVKLGLGEPSGIKDLSGDYKNSLVWGNRYLYQWVQDAILYAKTNKLGLFSGEYQP
ncbi:MAG: thermonuclease family protein [Acholeplasmataceae bacterium]|jgi:endonuclease YncB( thermonuclease family)/beta-lactam-binding protein with PASTA domain